MKTQEKKRYRVVSYSGIEHYVYSLNNKEMCVCFTRKTANRVCKLLNDKAGMKRAG